MHELAHHPPQIPTLNTALTATSLSQTLGNAVNVGENATHVITCAVPKGSMTLSIAVQLPAGVAALAANIVAVGSDITVESQTVDKSNPSQVLFQFGATHNQPDTPVNLFDASRNIVVQVWDCIALLCLLLTHRPDPNDVQRRGRHF